MRPLSWTLLALLVAVLVVAVAPSYYQGDSDLLKILGFTFALIVLIVGFVLVRQMNSRLARLAAVAAAIGQGNYTTRSDDQERDAVGLLAREINRMAAKIQDSINALEVQRRELDDSRSRLEQQNQQLAQQNANESSFGNYLSSISTVDSNSIADRSLNYLLDIAGAHFGQVYVVNETAKTRQLLKISERGIDRQVLKSLVPGDPEQGLPGEVIARKELIEVNTIDADSLPTVNLGITTARLSGVLGLPILFQDRAIGAVILGTLRTLDPATMRLVQNTIDALGSALNNALTYKTVQQQAVRLKQTNQELLEADRLRSEFVANMSHELRTPLNSIIGFSGVLMKNRNQSLVEKDLNYVEKINRNGKHLLSLINDILDLSKIEAGRMDLEFRPTQPVDIVDEVVDMLKTQAEARHLSLDFVQDREALRATVPAVVTDADKLKQVLINLIGNAIKFTHEGGVTVQLKPEPEHVRIDVIDTGIGIPEDKLSTVFEPFRQADSGTTRKYGGTGLGLAITRSIVDMLGGEVTVQSRIDRGSTFSVLLPQTAPSSAVAVLEAGAAEPINDPTAAETPPAARPGPPLAAVDNSANSAADNATASLSEAIADALAVKPGERTVLVVDDDPDARELLSGYIEELGAKPIPAAGGEQALVMAQQLKPDLITLDLMMPGLDGWEVLRQLKANPELERIPVVIISIVAERRQALVLGAMDALTKPIVQDDLLAILQRTLASTQRARVLAVDDNEEVLELYRSMLKDEVGEIRTALNGKQALEVLQDYRPDLLFLDLMMPEMDGLTLLRVLRTERQLVSLPVVVVTAKDLSESERRELEMRVVQVIQKGEEGLENQLRAALSQVLISGAAAD